MKTTKKYMTILLSIFMILTLTAQTSVVEARSQDAPETASTATHYVSINGSDSNAGTQSKPWRTIQKAANSAPVGAIIEVGAGNYGENVKISRDNLNFRTNGKVVTRSISISGNNINLSGFEVTGATGHGLNISGRNVIVENNIVHWNSLGNSTNGKCNSTSGGSWQSGIKLSVGADNVVVRNNRSYNNCGEGIAVTRGVNSIVENNIVYDNFSVNIYIDNSRDIAIRNNTVSCSDLNMRDGKRAKGISLGAEYYQGWGNQRHNISVAQNTVADCEYGIVLGEPFDGGLTSNVSIDANTIPSGTYRSISILTTKNQNIVVRNNLIFNSLYVSHPSGVTLSNNQIVSMDTTFYDVSITHWAYDWIETLYANGITGGCSSNRFCPNSPVTRAQMAVFLLRSKYSSSYSPPAATGNVFADVPTNAFAAAWIERMVAEGITAGCGNGVFCPNGYVNRAQMAVFLLRAKYGGNYTPPPASGKIFKDVPANAFAAAWIEQLVAEGVTSGCGGGDYCPSQAVTRAQMAVFLVKTFNLP